MTALEQDQPALRWGASLGLALAVHAVAIGAVLWWHARMPPVQTPAPAETVMVELAPLPSAPPAPPTELPPGPPQQEQRQTPPKAEPEPTRTPEPDRQRLQQEAEVPLPQQPAQRQHEDTAAADVNRTSAPPSVQAPPGREYAAEQSLAGAQPQAQGTWQAQVLGHLEKFKRYPRVAQRRRYEGTVSVQYSVDRQGNVLSARLATSSGREPLDDEAVAAMQRASPLPPPPPEIPGDPIEVTTPVTFTLRR
jgi:protein TonB